MDGQEESEILSNDSDDDMEFNTNNEANEDLEEDDDDENDDESSDSQDDDDEDEDDKDDETEKKGSNINEEEYQNKLSELENSISENKYQYQSYESIIQLTRDQGELNKLREYRVKMSEVFPLTEKLWLDWIRDERKYIDSDNDRKRIEDLFQKAIEDYLSVEIWYEYIQFSIGYMGFENGTENVRKVCEKAIELAGLHVNEGHKLWEVYREFELAILAGYQQSCAGSIQTPEQTKVINEQIQRILKILKTQLSICLNHMETTFEELKNFDESVANSEEVKNLYETSLYKYKQIEPFELALNNALSDPVKKLSEYKKYLDFELKLIDDLKNKTNNKKNVKTVNVNSTSTKEFLENDQLNYHRQRIKCLFERAIADNTNCLDTDLWLKYIFYLIEEESKYPSESSKEYNLKVFKRSVRNCTWSSDLWINYAKQLEKLNYSNEQVKNVYKEAMSSTLQSSNDYLQLWHVYLTFLKRSLLTDFENKSQQEKDEIAEELRDTFQKAINQLYDYFKLSGDPTFSLERFWADIEAKYFNSMDKSRKIYNEMILAKSDIGEYSSDIWSDFYALECIYGDEKHQRKLLNRALNELKDNNAKQIIYELLLKFEKLNGNLYQFSLVDDKYREFKYKIQSELALKQQDKAEQNKQKKQNQQKTEFKKNESRENKPQKVTNIDTKKQPNNLKRKTSDNDAMETNSNQLKDQDGFAIPSLPLTSNEQTIKKPKKETIVIDQTSDSRKPANLNSNCTVFISNLKYDVDEAKLKNIFEKEPGFKELRLVKHWSDKSKGYGYVEFEKPEQAEKALKLDRTLLDGRPVFVSKNEDKSLNLGENKFKYANRLEKNKLFVTGLPFTTDKPALEDIFKNFGKLKEVRIVTYKSGKSKGLAYVEFEDEQSAAKALIQTDRMRIGDNEITVAISNPPKRKQPFEMKEENSEKSTEIKKSLGSGSVVSRTQTPASSSGIVSFVPRSQQLMNRKKTLNLK